MIDLTELDWQLSGWTPFLWWRTPAGKTVEIEPFPVRLPCSVQRALRDREMLPDWNVGRNARLCEWVENRHWMFSCEVTLPADGVHELVLEGVDHSGWVCWDSSIVAEFRGSHCRHVIALPAGQPGETHRLALVFDLPPRWLGQFGWTSRQSVGKPRFYYTWDWMARLVQTGVTGAVRLRRAEAPRLELDGFDTAMDSLTVRCRPVNLSADAPVTLRLADGSRILREEQTTASELAAGIRWENLGVEPWQVNGRGKAKLYDFSIEPGNAEPLHFRAGFRTIRLLPCAGAPAGANPWLWEVNGETVFIQGINWTPVRPDYADTPAEQYRRLIADYRAMNVNLFRIWGGADRERDEFYDLCDESGILVWQEFPLCSSGIENLPPETGDSIRLLLEAGRDYLDALVRHPSLAMWCGGNELFYEGASGPCSGNEPALAHLAELVARRDPGRRFVPASPSGPSFGFSRETCGKGLHHDVHGPWKAPGLRLEDGWIRDWEEDDVLFRSEFGCPGAADVATIRRYAGDLPELPVSRRNPLWRNPLDWWVEEEAFAAEHDGREPVSLEEYVRWSQARQERALVHAVRCAKRRFPATGGVILWMGHDSFPCPANTSLIDFDGNWKPAAFALAEIFREPVESTVDSTIEAGVC